MTSWDWSLPPHTSTGEKLRTQIFLVTGQLQSLRLTSLDGYRAGAFIVLYGIRRVIVPQNI